MIKTAGKLRGKTKARISIFSNNNNNIITLNNAQSSLSIGYARESKKWKYFVLFLLTGHKTLFSKICFGGFPNHFAKKSATQLLLQVKVGEMERKKLWEIFSSEIYVVSWWWTTLHCVNLNTIGVQKKEIGVQSVQNRNALLLRKWSIWNVPNVQWTELHNCILHTCLSLNPPQTHAPLSLLHEKLHQKWSAQLKQLDKTLAKMRWLLQEVVGISTLLILR